MKYSIVYQEFNKKDEISAIIKPPAKLDIIMDYRIAEMLAEKTLANCWPVTKVFILKFTAFSTPVFHLFT